MVLDPRRPGKLAIAGKLGGSSELGIDPRFPLHYDIRSKKRSRDAAFYWFSGKAWWGLSLLTSDESASRSEAAWEAREAKKTSLAH